MYRFKPFFILLFLLGCSHSISAGKLVERPDVQEFISEMVEEHDFSAVQLEQVFSNASLSKSIIEAISRPAEAKPWYKYRPIFLTEDRIRQGVKFLEENRETLRRAEQEYGVPMEIIVAIIGVETRYGRHAGRYKVVNSLSTLAFEYPRRSKFFRSELKHFFLLAREQGLDPLQVQGSYAGAMGIPQFISSSYRNYAVDFDGDNKIDIWENPVDAIGSVGNYFRTHGWKAGDIIASRARVEDKRYLAALSKGLEPHISTAELPKYGVSVSNLPAQHVDIKLLEYELENSSEFWVGFHNFYVITRYNHSALYAMAVYQLSREIRTRVDAGNDA